MAVMTRITTNMIRRNYQNNLTSTIGGLESTRKQVETGRRFQSSYEDPTASAKAATLERRYAQVQDHMSNVENAQNWIYTQEDAAMQVNDYAITISKTYSVAAVNGTNASMSTRETYATALESMQETMVAALNVRYGDTYVFSGNRGKDVPFTLEDSNGDNIRELFYRGVPVDDLDDNSADADIKALLNEHSYVDLGFGMEIDDQGEVIPSSAFDMALPGVKLIGYGKNDEGVSNNMVNLVGQMAAVLREETFVEADYKQLWNQFEDSANALRDEVTVIGTKEKQLENTLDRLENEKINIETQFDATVNIDPAEAIMNYSWADYAYNSALKVGTSIISPSLLDFINS